MTRSLNPWTQLLILSFITLLVILFIETAGMVPDSRGGSREPEPALDERGLPDFPEIREVEARKTQFFEFLRPIAEAANGVVERRRARLQELLADLQSNGEVSAEDWRWTLRMAKSYRVEVKGGERPRVTVIQELLRRVDRIPVSLILAQAAKESGWGTSRFAQQGNNLFGQWCFKPGCGIVPARRESGKSHEVRRFATVRASVASYLHNLNSHPRYKELRAIRARLRRSGDPVTGFALAAGLHGYSAHGQDYVESVRALIRHNELGPVANMEQPAG